MTPDLLDEAVQIALHVVRDVDEAHDVVAALARAGWLHNPGRVDAETRATRLENTLRAIVDYFDASQATAPS